MPVLHCDRFLPVLILKIHSIGVNTEIIKNVGFICIPVSSDVLLILFKSQSNTEFLDHKAKSKRFLVTMSSFISGFMGKCNSKP